MLPNNKVAISISRKSPNPDLSRAHINDNTTGTNIAPTNHSKDAQNRQRDQPEIAPSTNTITADTSPTRSVGIPLLFHASAGVAITISTAANAKRGPV